MSHKVIGEVKVGNLDLLKKVASLKGFEVRTGTQKFHSHSSKGLLVQFPGWKYPVCFTETGEVNYDNYEGKWGAQEALDRFLRDYAEAEITQNASAMGFAVTSTQLESGDIVLDLTKDQGHISCTLDNQGKVAYEVNGVPGGNCLEYASFLGQAIQGQMEYTEEFGLEPRQKMLNMEVES